ncbi:ABC transporter ATP-binding protein [Alloiococcus sp. CFN-8]|uniref:ABC transporter ATP-binding protein n=1 Tax=Alloiococcus sp. CFN-8 TaxID=3416081 RepID=UPI003CF523A5
MENKSQLSVENLTFSYDKEKEILHGISASFSNGKITAILGPNGCGKSTLLNLLSGVLKPSSGNITLKGCDIREIKRTEVARNIAVVHQKNRAPSDITVENLVSAGRTPYKGFFKGSDKVEDQRAIEKALRDTETLEFAERPISALSGGQMQRVWMAMALAQETDILLLDEITTFLDIHYQLEILHLISELNRKNGTTILMVLHDINLAFEFCDEVIIMKEGNIIAQGDINRVVDEEILKEAFDVSAKILTIDDKKQCIFSRIGGINA